MVGLCSICIQNGLDNIYHYDFVLVLMAIYHSTQFQIPRNCEETIVHIMLNTIFVFTYFLFKYIFKNGHGHIPRIPLDVVVDNSRLSRQ